MAKLVLGRGLGALIQPRPAPAGNDAAAAAAVVQPDLAPGESIQQVALEEIRSSPFQPRKEFKPETLNELIESIRERGIIQPLIVRRVNGHYELIAGERRWRAAQTLGLAKAPVILRQATDQEVLELALIENLQRADLNVVEEARAYERLADEFSLRQEDIAKRVGKSRAAVANAMRLLDLDPQVQSWLTQDRITIGHAKVLLALKSPDEQRLLAEIVIRQRSTVRAAEKLVEAHLKKQGNEHVGPGSRTTGTRGQPAELSPVLQRVQNRLREHLGTHVALRHGEKKGSIEIEYYGDDDLNRLLALVGLEPDKS
jgi:ParB family chromosome partitioning protein